MNFERTFKLRKVIAIGVSILINFNNRILFKSKKVTVKKYSGATSKNIVVNMQVSLHENPDFLIVYTATNDFNLVSIFNNNINLLNNLRKIHKMAKQVSL